MRHLIAGLAIIAALVVAAIALDGVRADLSTGNTFTLSPRTRELLTDLDRPLSMALFFDRDQPGYAQVADLAERFATASDQVQLSFEDPNGPRALELNVASGAVVVTSAGTAPAVVRLPDEVELAAAVAEATARPAPRVEPNTAPSQPLYPTPLGRALLFWLPVITAPALAALAGLVITFRRRH